MRRVVEFWITTAIAIGMLMVALVILRCLSPQVAASISLRSGMGMW
jgi:hypothetical protein